MAVLRLPLLHSGRAEPVMLDDDGALNLLPTPSSQPPHNRLTRDIRIWPNFLRWPWFYVQQTSNQLVLALEVMVLCPILIFCRGVLDKKLPLLPPISTFVTVAVRTTPLLQKFLILCRKRAEHVLYIKWELRVSSIRIWSQMWGTIRWK